MPLSGNTTRDIEDLLDRLKQGDVDAPKLLTARAYERMRWIAHKIVRDPLVGDPTDVLHETWAALERAVAEVKPASARDFLAFVGHKIRFMLIDMIRKVKGRDGSRVLPVSLGDELIDAVIAQKKQDIAVAPRPIAAAGEELDIQLSLDVLEAIESLPKEEQEVVVLRMLLGNTCEETAELLSTTVDTVRGRWDRAKKTLAILLADLDEGPAS